MARERLFSVTREDCDWQTFRSGGPGGQHQNKVESGVRCVHRASGATGESRTERSQYVNKQLAFRRMAETKAFQFWLKMEAARRMGQPSVDQIVEEQMQPSKIRTEVHDENNRWVETKTLDSDSHST